jgi:putative tryptophan/tyrosine transport system substrate-binding protein
MRALSKTRCPALATELVVFKVDVIMALGTLHALAAKQATKTIPIVFAGVTGPVTSGLVPSLARPGGNVTGRRRTVSLINWEDRDVLL